MSMIAAAILPIVIIAARALNPAAAFRVPLVTSPLLQAGRRLHPRPAAPDRGSVPAAAGHAPPIALRGLFGDGEAEASGESSEIPPELRDEIYAAEANTPATQGRQLRVTSYVLMTLAGITTGFFNAFLTGLRFGDGAPTSDLAYYGFGWVQDNFLLSFAFTNKIGGAIGLLSAGLFGTLAEVEIRSKNENAEKIWAEMRRRKSLRENPTGGKKKKRRSLAKLSRRDMTGTQKKRLSALEELMVDDEGLRPSVQEQRDDGADSGDTKDLEGNVVNEDVNGSKGGVLGTLKGFYEKADSMAASQALMLNKELEDMGVIDKITDESGLRVVGKEQAASVAKTQSDRGVKKK